MRSAIVAHCLILVVDVIVVTAAVVDISVDDNDDYCSFVSA